MRPSNDNQLRASRAQAGRRITYRPNVMGNRLEQLGRQEQVDEHLSFTSCGAWVQL